MAPRLAATQGRPAGAGLQAPTATKQNPTQHHQHQPNSQQTAAQQHQQQQAGAGSGAAPSASSGGGGQQGVPALLLSKGYDVLGVIGEVRGQPVLRLCRFR